MAVKPAALIRVKNTMNTMPLPVLGDFSAVAVAASLVSLMVSYY